MQMVFLHGPAASGKLTTARALQSLTGYSVFHNHLVVDALLALFSFGSPEFVRLRDQYWMSAFEAAAAADRSFVFTFAPEATVPEDFPARTRRAIEQAGGSVHFVELRVSDAEQEARIENADRKRFNKLADVETLRRLRRGDAGPPIPPADLVIDTTLSSPTESAALIVRTFDLRPREPHEMYPA